MGKADAVEDAMARVLDFEKKWRDALAAQEARHLATVGTLGGRFRRLLLAGVAAAALVGYGAGFVGGWLVWGHSAPAAFAPGGG